MPRLTPEDPRYFLNSELRKIKMRASKTLKLLTTVPPDFNWESWEGTYLSLQEVADGIDSLRKEIMRRMPKV